MDMSTYFFGTVWSLRIWRVGIWGVVALRSDCCFLPSLGWHSPGCAERVAHDVY